MRNRTRNAAQRGFTLIELMIAGAIFIVLSGAAFGLLALSQKSYQSQSQVLNSFQEARLGLDQIIRDVNDSGYPPKAQFSILPTQLDRFAAAPIAWAPNYPNIPCPVGSAGTCTTPSDFDLIIETDPLHTTGQVQWIRYQLQGTTLLRGVVNKPPTTADPDASTPTAQLAPFVQNVMNNATTTQIGQFRAIYPAMYPGVAPVPIFTYWCDLPSQSGSAPQPCASEGVDNLATNIRDIEITLIVMAPLPDAQTGQPRLVQLNGRGHRINPNE